MLTRTCQKIRRLAAPWQLSFKKHGVLVGNFERTLKILVCGRGLNIFAREKYQFRAKQLKVTGFSTRGYSKKN